MDTRTRVAHMSRLGEIHYCYVLPLKLLVPVPGMIPALVPTLLLNALLVQYSTVLVPGNKEEGCDSKHHGSLDCKPTGSSYKNFFATER